MAITAVVAYRGDEKAEENSLLRARHLVLVSRFGQDSGAGFG